MTQFVQHTTNSHDSQLTKMLEINVPTYSAYNDEYFSKIVNKELSNTKDSDDFYQKLTELRNEQKKSLKFMEELYNQKQLIKDSVQKSASTIQEALTNPKQILSDNPSIYKLSLNAVSAYESPQNLTKSLPDYGEFMSEMKREVSNLSFKPPLPQKSSTNSVKFNDTVSVTNISKSDEHDNSTSGYDSNGNIYESIESDLRRIERIWSEFKFEDAKSVDFNRKFEKKIKKTQQKQVVPRRSNSSLKKRPLSATTAASIEWVPRVTVPEPFSMTLRENLKNEKKEKLKQETIEQREKRIETDLRESKKQFKANPAPAHTLIPLYQKLKMEEELRKIRLKKMSQEYMEKVCKPFNLTDSKKDQKTQSLKERRHSYSEGLQNNESNVKSFTAQPMPDFYFNEELISEKMKEDELYKQIKNRIRAIELLKQSKLPSNMELMEQKKMLEQERNALYLKEIHRLNKKIDTAMKHTSKSAASKYRLAHDVPDYEALYKKFIIELETRKAQNRKHTKIEPFNLLTEQRFKKDLSYLDLEDDAKLNSRPQSASFSRSCNNLVI
jgi:protein FAM161A